MLRSASTRQSRRRYNGSLYGSRITLKWLNSNMKTTALCRLVRQMNVESYRLLLLVRLRTLREISAALTDGDGGRRSRLQRKSLRGDALTRSRVPHSRGVVAAKAPHSVEPAAR